MSNAEIQHQIELLADEEQYDPQLWLAGHISESALLLAQALGEHNDPLVRYRCARTLETAGGLAHPVTPLLLSALQNEREREVRKACVMALKALSPINILILEVVAAVFSTEGDHDTRMECIGLLSRCDTPNDAVITALAEPLHEFRDPVLQTACANALGSLASTPCDWGASTPKAVDALTVPLCQSESQSLLQACAQALSAWGPRAVSALPVLFRVFSESDNATTCAALVEALGAVGSEPGTYSDATKKEYVERFCYLLKQGDPRFGWEIDELQAAAARALSLIDPGNAAVVEALSWGLTYVPDCADETELTRLACLVGLGRIAEPGEETLAAMESATSDGSSKIRAIARQLLEKRNPGKV